MLFKLTVLPKQTEVWLPANAPLTDIEYELRGEEVIPSGCRAGACGVCAIEVISGIEVLGSRNPEEAEFLEALGFVGTQYRLACQCRVGGDVSFRVPELPA